LASELHCFVEDIKDRMSIDELTGWAAWFAIKAEDEEKAIKKANAKR
jgi:hypothetical protein